MKLFKFGGQLILIIVLTILTQIGGIVYFISLLIFWKPTNHLLFKRILTFSILYLGATFLIIPNVAPIFGREKIKNSEKLQARSLFYTICNRNYVKPELNKSLESIAGKLDEKHANIKLIYLDANFPFIDGFPLIPHLSHNDGKKIDVSFIYEDSSKHLNNKKKSISGYGVFEKPRANENNQISICENKGFWQYSLARYITLGSINKDINFSQIGTKSMAKMILQDIAVSKLFIEPHLKTRLKLNNNKVRYHGCHAVRHDDHIHFQLR